MDKIIRDILQSRLDSVINMMSYESKDLEKYREEYESAQETMKIYEEERVVLEKALKEME